MPEKSMESSNKTLGVMLKAIVHLHSPNYLFQNLFHMCHVDPLNNHVSSLNHLGVTTSKSHVCLGIGWFGELGLELNKGGYFSLPWLESFQNDLASFARWGKGPIKGFISILFQYVIFMLQCNWISELCFTENRMKVLKLVYFYHLRRL